jgi:hypothetical protein
MVAPKQSHKRVADMTPEEHAAHRAWKREYNRRYRARPGNRAKHAEASRLSKRRERDPSEEQR